MPEKTKNADPETRPLPAWVWVLLFVLAAAAFFAGLDMPLVGPDEPRYAQVAREMFDRGDLVTPTLGGYHWFEKPALLYWLQIAAYKLLGVNEFAARLGPALFGIGTVASLWILGRSVAENRRDLGLWFAVIAASTLGIIVFAHGASFDIIVTFPMTAAMVSLFVFDRGEDRTLRSSILPLLLFYVFVGLSVLAKGLIGIVFPAAIVAFYHVLSWRSPSRRLAISAFWGTAVTLAVAAVWYWPMYDRHGWEFIDQFFLQHHFQRFTSNKYQHPQPFYFYLWVLPLMTIPWLPFFGAAIVGRLRDLVRAPVAVGATTKRSALLTFAWAWMLVPLVFFSFSGSKLPGYILPAVPAAIVITGVYIYDLVNRSYKWRIMVAGLAGLTFPVLIAVALLAAPRFAEQESVRSLISAANDRGYTSEPVLIFLRTSHNAEFYAAGRLVRDEEGQQQRILSKDQLAGQLRSLGGRAILLVPKEYASQITAAAEFDAEVLGRNDEFAIAAIALKN